VNSAKNEKYKKILVIRFSSLGDIILTTPLIKLLKESFPSAEIDYCTKEDYRELMNSNPYIRKIIAVGSDFDFARLKQLKNTISLGGYDLIIDAHNNLRTFYLRFFLRFKSKILVFKKYSLRKFLLVKFKINLMKKLPPIAQRYFKIIEPVTEKKDVSTLPEIFTNSSAKEKINNIFKELSINPNNKIIAIAPSSKHFTKTYPAELYIELINKFDKDISVLLIGKGNDIMQIEQIREKIPGNIYNLCNILSVIELAELLKRCSLFISGDTGPMHIAEAMNVPLIMLAGSSVREFGFYPQSEKAVVVENNNLKCRPCSHIGLSACPLGHFQCMMELNPDMILNQINSLLS
jgi:lipopolysaccharide heptosyltransferase II